MFNGTSVITHVIVSIWHQPTSHMISSVQMCSSFIPWWEWGYNHSKSILQTWICINLQFISSFVSFVGIDLLCCRISRLLSWLPCFGPSPSLALPTPWHLSGEPGEVTDLVTKRCVSQEPEALLCRAFLILFTKDVQHPKLFKPKWTPRYSLHWAPRSNPITGFQPPKHFFNGQTISSWFPVSWMFFFFFFFSGVTSRLSFFWVILSGPSSRCFSCPLEVVSPLFRAATGRLMACMDLSRGVTGATILAVGSWLFGFQSWSFRVTK